MSAKKTKGATAKKQAKAPLTISQIVVYILLFALVGAALFMFIGCLVFAKLLYAVIIGLSTLVLTFVVFELIRMDRKANAEHKARVVGNTIMEINGAGLKWADGTRDFGDVQLCNDGIVVDADDGTKTYPWVGVVKYSTPASHVVELMLVGGDSLRITCNSDIKLVAAERVLSDHVAKEDAE